MSFPIFECVFESPQQSPQGAADIWLIRSIQKNRNLHQIGAAPYQTPFGIRTPNGVQRYDLAPF